MQYSEEFHVQKLKAAEWSTVETCDTEREAIDALDYHDDGTQSWRIIRTTEVTLIQRSRGK